MRPAWRIQSHLVSTVRPPEDLEHCQWLQVSTGWRSTTANHRGEHDLQPAALTLHSLTANHRGEHDLQPEIVDLTETMKKKGEELLLRLWLVQISDTWTIQTTLKRCHTDTPNHLISFLKQRHASNQDWYWSESWPESSCSGRARAHICW